ncbi:MAG: flavoprotein [Candidatus Marinimicrobia bacterium]|nr:flavoprotein [Candidatus Neomarinimicrobiota bacterium]
MKHLIISTGLRNKGNSWTMANHLRMCLEKNEQDTELLELSNYDMPFCGEGAYLDHPTTKLFAEKVEWADGLVISTPVYNYNVNAVAKNFIELTGKAWKNKTVGFLCAAGGEKSYMSILGLANSLMLDFRCVIIPRFVYASGRVFNRGSIMDDTVKKRIDGLSIEMIRFTTNLNSG